MAIKGIRLQEPTTPLSSEGDFGADRYRPSIDWNSASGDVPIVAKAFNTSASDVTRRVRYVHSSYSFDIPVNNAWNGSFDHADNFWNWNTSSGFRVSGDTNARSFIIGHKGVKSADNAKQSWQRGVIGISMKHWMQPPAGYYGHYIYDMTLLYRKWSDNSQFYGVDLLVDGNLQNNCRQNYTGRTPFKSNSPVRGDSEGSFFACMGDDHPAYNLISEQKLVFQGIYFKWATYDSVTQFQGKFHLWNPRMLFDSSSSGDRGNRICLPRMWDFAVAGTSNVLKLTDA
jgi:hypothetical protein